tara:strand:- start:379 stop:792 length:414 start_codon:yes stop_codon:yes gene_type:complete
MSEKEVLEPNLVNQAENELSEIVTDNDLVTMYDDIVDMVHKDRTEVDEVLANFTNMVMNEGDGSSASKEAIVNLLKMKMDGVDKLSKIADLKTRIKLKERNTFPGYLAQHNTYNLGNQMDKRAMLEQLNKKGKKNDK